MKRENLSRQLCSYIGYAKITGISSKEKKENMEENKKINDKLEMALANGADANFRCNADGRTPFMRLALRGLPFAFFQHRAELLLDHKADINAKDVDGHTAIFYILNYGNEDKNLKAKFLIDNGANPYILDNSGKNQIEPGERQSFFSYAGNAYTAKSAKFIDEYARSKGLRPKKS